MNTRDEIMSQTNDQ